MIWFFFPSLYEELLWNNPILGKNLWNDIILKILLKQRRFNYLNWYNNFCTPCRGNYYGITHTNGNIFE